MIFNFERGHIFILVIKLWIGKCDIHQSPYYGKGPVLSFENASNYAKSEVIFSFPRPSDHDRKMVHGDAHWEARLYDQLPLPDLDKEGNLLSEYYAWDLLSTLERREEKGTAPIDCDVITEKTNQREVLSSIRARLSEGDNGFWERPDGQMQWQRGLNVKSGGRKS